MNRISLDDVFERVFVQALEKSDAFAKLGEGDGLEDFDDGFADFFHDAANPAFLFAGTTATFVKTLTHATDWRERAFDQADDFGEVDFFGRKLEAVAAGNAAFAFEEAGRLEVIEDLFEEAFGNVLGGRDRLDSNDGVAVIQAQNDQCPQSIMPSLRKLHEEILQCTATQSRFVLTGELKLY